MIPQELSLGRRELNVTVVAHHLHPTLSRIGSLKEFFLVIEDCINLTVFFPKHDDLAGNGKELRVAEGCHVAWKKVAHAACYMSPCWAIPSIFLQPDYSK